MKVTMHENIRLTKRDTRIARIWQILGVLDEAISASPLEHLERRVVALEQKVLGFAPEQKPKSAEYKTMK